MNHKYLIFGFLGLFVGVLVPFQVYKIRQRRLAERVHAEQHLEDEDHSCCSCH